MVVHSKIENRSRGQSVVELEKGFEDEFIGAALGAGFVDISLKRVLVTVLYVEEKEMRAWYEKGYGMRSVTDVLSFPESDVWNMGVLHEEDSLFSTAHTQNEYELGVLVVCVPQALQQASEQGHAFTTELAWLLVHGTLHLIGYDHQDAKQEERMRSIEQSILTSKLGTNRYWVSDHTSS